MEIERKKDKIIIKLGSESTKDIYKKQKKGAEEAMRTKKVLQLQWPRSLKERGGTPNYMIKAFEEGVKLGAEVGRDALEVEIVGRLSELKRFEQSLTEMGFTNNDIESFERCLFKLGAIQTIGRSGLPKSAYPEEELIEVLSVKDAEEKIDQLKQVKVVEEEKMEKKPLYKLSSKGDKILKEFCEKNEYDKLKKNLDELIEDEVLPPRLLYSYFHEDSTGFNELRTSENVNHPGPLGDEESKKEICGLIGDILIWDSNEEIESEGFEISDSTKHDLVRKINKIWDKLEKNDLAINAPIVDYRLYDNDNDFMVLEFASTGEDTRCMPNPIHKKLFEIVKKRISGHKIILDILMIINKHHESPENVKSSLKKEDNDYDLTKEDLAKVEKVVNRLAERNITSKWSSSGEVPYIMKNYEQFLEFSKDYLLGKEELELEE